VSVFFKAAWCADNMGNYSVAQEMGQGVLEAREDVLGAEHSDLLTSVGNLRLVLERQGKYEEAEAMHRRALEVIEKVLGRDHPSTLISISNLALTLGSKGFSQVRETRCRSTQHKEVSFRRRPSRNPA
jgi:tetratricopeptide (TPR) repeat protein